MIFEKANKINTNLIRIIRKMIRQKMLIAQMQKGFTIGITKIRKRYYHDFMAINMKI